ncbi:MAG: hypothetical protein F7C35_04770 [Desulfurococcales archaeon]|nr:hypothetical protein [Desulfurococcales archaeon]
MDALGAALECLVLPPVFSALITLGAVAVTVGLNGVTLALRSTRSILSSALLGLLGGAAGLMVSLGVSAGSEASSGITFAAILLFMMSLFTTLSITFFTLEANRVYRGYVSVEKHVSYVLKTTGRLLSVATGLGFAVFLASSSWAPLGEGVFNGLALAVGASYMMARTLLNHAQHLPRVRGYRDNGLSTLTSLQATLIWSVIAASLLLLFVSILITGGIVTDYTGLFLATVGFAALMTIPLTLYYIGHLDRWSLASIGLEAFHGEPKANEPVEEGMRSILTLGLTAGVIAGLAALVLYIVFTPDKLGELGWGLATLAALTLFTYGGLREVERVSRGGLTGRILPLAVWAASLNLRECMEEGMRSSSPYWRAALEGVSSMLCEEGHFLGCEREREVSSIGGSN